MTTNPWVAVDVAPIAWLADLWAVVLERGQGKRCPKWRFRVAPDAALQLQPRPVPLIPAELQARGREQQVLAFEGRQPYALEVWCEKSTMNDVLVPLCQRYQDFPVSIEVQFLGGRGDGTPRTTANLCTPGTHVVMNGALETTHCVNSTSRTYDGDQWVRVEVEVRGAGTITHRVDGEVVLTYERPQVDGGAVAGHDPAAKVDGRLLEGGSISLQAESHPIEFRKVELLDLVGCTDTRARNYRAYFEKSDPSACRD